MSEEHNKATYRRWFREVAGEGRLDVVDELVTPEYVVNVPGTPLQQLTAAEHKALISAIHTAFPDWTETIEDIVAEDDKVVARLTVEGTHDGPLRNFPAPGQDFAATGRRVRSSFIGIARFADGRIAEAWTQFDTMGVAGQIGLLDQVHLPQ
ncbi:ester cyclase [Pseudonocardia sp. CA-107938]|uniref:ester cyclase n=1 Tax=Pseudonocardia sp. CA-107938 TaxID=3240021 RepID=UPI003D922836